MHNTFIHQQVAQARRQELPHVISKVPSGWVVLGEKQLLKGYCLLLPDPVVPDLNTLTHHDRIQYLADMALIGDVLLEVTDAYRINYEILGNKEPALHAHVFPRYTTEKENFRVNNPWVYDWLNAEKACLSEYKGLMDKITGAITKRLSFTRN